MSKKPLFSLYDGIRIPRNRDIIEWAREVDFKLPNSLRSSRFNPDLTPWLKEPLRKVSDEETQILTLIGAIQGGKSTLGEVAIPYFVDVDPGSILYNWEDDQKAPAVWDERFEPIVEANDFLKRKKHPDPKKWKKCEVIFNDGYYLRMQGLNAKKNRQSRSVRYEINEEVKDYRPGQYSDVKNRVSASWNSKIINLSPAGKWNKELEIGDELYEEWKVATCHEWYVRCPECGEYQRLYFSKEEGVHGGLIWDSEASKMANGRYDYSILGESLRYECGNPNCKAHWKDSPTLRKQLSESGKYIQTNNGAMPGCYSYRYNALTIDWVPWLQLVKEFHAAVAAVRRGDMELFQDFVQKRETEFYDDSDRPGVKTIALTKDLKQYEGIDGAVRIMSVDRQKDHFWIVVRDWKKIEEDDCYLHTRLVWEGRVDAKEEIEDKREEFGVEKRLTVIDSGYRATDVYKICAEYGYIAIKGADKDSFPFWIEQNGEKIKTRKIYSVPDKIDAYEGTSEGGKIWIDFLFYSKQGIRDRLEWVKTSDGIIYEIPDDVSEDYKKHHQAEELVEYPIKKTGEITTIWRQIKTRNDLFVCELYQCLVAEIVGLIGSDHRIVKRPITKEELKNVSKL